MDSWGTHLPVLMTFMARTQGPVLELGCGDSSTPMLHAFCKQRTIVSVDGDPSFIERYSELVHPQHLFLYVPDWALFDVRDVSPVWEIALVDHAPAEQRLVDIERLRDRTKFIIVHDTHDPFYEETLASFRYRLHYDRLVPHTTVVSDTINPNTVWSDR